MCRTGESLWIESGNNDHKYGFTARSLLRLASASSDIISTMAIAKAIKTDFWLIFGCFVFNVVGEKLSIKLTCTENDLY